MRDPSGRACPPRSPREHSVCQFERHGANRAADCCGRPCSSGRRSGLELLPVTTRRRLTIQSSPRHRRPDRPCHDESIDRRPAREALGRRTGDRRPNASCLQDRPYSRMTIPTASSLLDFSTAARRTSNNRASPRHPRESEQTGMVEPGRRDCRHHPCCITLHRVILKAGVPGTTTEHKSGSDTTIMTD